MRNRIKKNDDVDLACELCGKPTNIRMRLGDLPDKVPNLLDRKQKTYRHGMCAECKKDLAEGCVIFVDAADRCMKVNAAAAKEKIQEVYWGKVVKIPTAAMDELVVAYLRANPDKVNPKPESSGQLGNGDGTPAA